MFVFCNRNYKKNLLTQTTKLKMHTDDVVGLYIIIIVVIIIFIVATTLRWLLLLCDLKS